ncbi:MAG: XkdX family protein [Ruthenibacterium sp.]
MFDFLRLQYRMGKIDATQLCNFVPKWLTDAQYQKIISDKMQK